MSRQGPAGDDMLDNLVWHALAGPHAELAVAAPRAARYPGAVAPFAALADPFDERSWSDLATVLGPGGRGALFRDEATVPAGWGETWRGDGLQMVAGGAVTHPGHHLRHENVEVVRLADADADDMAALVERNRPGPWAVRTHTLGPFLGVRDGTRLVAMGGTRLQAGRYWEISAVCTDADQRGRGLASTVVVALAGLIREHDRVPVLHVAATNTMAIRLYRELGLEARRNVVFVAVVAPGEAPELDR